MNDEILEPAPHWSATVAWKIHCPTCGDETMDRIGGYGDHSAVTIHPDRDDYDSPIGTRGGYLRVELRCPAGHHFALILANHKGDEILALVPSACRIDGPCCS